MKETIIFLVIFLIIFSFSVFIFNGRFIYAQIKYSFIGIPFLENLKNSNDNDNQPQITEEIPKNNDFVLAKLPVSVNANIEQSLRLTIPAIGVDAPIVFSQNPDSSAMEKDLEKGVARYPDSNIILGHSSAYPWYKGSYGSIFSLLNKLEIGNEILITSNGNIHKFIVKGKQIELPKNLVFEDTNNDSIIYLVSCWPINTAWKRLVIKAEKNSIY